MQFGADLAESFVLVKGLASFSVPQGGRGGLDCQNWEATAKPYRWWTQM